MVTKTNFAVQYCIHFYSILRKIKKEKLTQKKTIQSSYVSNFFYYNQ